MACYAPVTLYKSTGGPNPETGKWPLVGIKEGYRDRPQLVPCGRCIGCRLERSRQWAIRCVKESQMHLQNSFITLTYSDDQLIYGGAEHAILYPRHLELFWKRLRKEIGPFRYFACGEYGEKTKRPHYHACLFGHDFQDKTIYSKNYGITIYQSQQLDTIWTHGDCKIGEVNFETAAYVARYIMKKRLGQEAEKNQSEGIEPEFVRMSRRPGIGSTWLDEFQNDVFPRDYVVIRNGIKCLPPKYFSRKYFASHPIAEQEILERRKIKSYNHLKNQTPERLSTRERIKYAQIKSLKRQL